MKPSELLADPKSWTKGDFARTAAGEGCNPGGPLAVSYCTDGALLACYAFDTDPNAEEAYKKAHDLLRKAIGYEVTTWNDAPHRTHGEVIAMLRSVGL